MAIFGYQTQGNEYEGGNANYIRGAIFTCPENGTPTKMTVCLTGLQTIKCAIYKRNGNNYTLVAYTEKKTVSGAKGWQDFAITNVLEDLAANQEYLLCVWGVANYVWYDSDANFNYLRRYQIFNGFPSSFTATISFYQKISIYCTYASSAPSVGYSTKMSMTKAGI